MDLCICNRSIWNLLSNANIVQYIISVFELSIINILFLVNLTQIMILGLILTKILEV